MKANDISLKSKNSIKDSKEDRVFGFIVDILLIIIGVMTIFPLIFVLSASVSDPVMVNSGQVLLLPKGFNLDGYKAVFENTWVLTGYRNSLIYTVAGTFLNVLVTFMAHIHYHERT